MNSIEQIQYQAARAVTGTWKGTNTSKLYDELGWESLTDRRWFHRLIHYFKISNGLTPSYLSELLPPPRPMLYGSRRENILSILPSNTVRYQHSFFPNSTRLWNEIGVELRSKDTLGQFKNSLLHLIRHEGKSLFDVNHPRGEKYLFRLRVGLSSLKSHKRAHHFLDTPSDLCDCGEEPEDVKHYFLACKAYDEYRDTMLISVRNSLSSKNIIANSNAHLASILLYGHSDLNDEANRQILLASIKYMHSTKRFDQ